MPPPQCPECGRFLATAFVQQIRTEPAPCPRCGTELSLAEDEDDDDQRDTTTPDEAPPVPPPAATLPADGAAGAGDALDDADEPDEADEPDDTQPAEKTARSGKAGKVAKSGKAAKAASAPPAAVPEDVEPEPETSVRPPDLAPARDPLEGWDESGALRGPPDEPDPVVLAAGVGIGLVVGMLLGGRDHRGLGALLGAALGAVLTRLRG